MVEFGQGVDSVRKLRVASSIAGFGGRCGKDEGKDEGAYSC